jgi:hypothetical protein
VPDGHKFFIHWAGFQVTFNNNPLVSRGDVPTKIVHWMQEYRRRFLIECVGMVSCDILIAWFGACAPPQPTAMPPCDFSCSVSA